MANAFSLTVSSRKAAGKKVKLLRRQGRIPGVLYGYKVENQPIECQEQEFHKIFVKAGESTIVDLSLDKRKIPVLIHQIAMDPVSGKYAHVDFLALDLTKEVTTRVPLRTTGEAPGAKELGGILIHQREALTVRCLPKDLPHVIDVDISSLKNFHDTVTVSGLTLPLNVKVEENPDEILVSLQPPRKEEEETPLAAVEAVAAEGVATEGAVPADGAEGGEKKATPEATKAEPKKEKGKKGEKK